MIMYVVTVWQRSGWDPFKNVAQSWWKEQANREEFLLKYGKSDFAKTNAESSTAFLQKKKE